MKKRSIPNYDNDLTCMIDISKALTLISGWAWDTRYRVLNHIIKRELGSKYWITDK